MKRFLSMLLCLCMIVSALPCMPVVASAAEDEDGLTTDKQTLKKFGFDIDESAYNTHALKPGTHAVETQNELVMTTSHLYGAMPFTLNSFYEFEKSYVETVSSALNGTVKKAREFTMTQAADIWAARIDNYTPPYFVTSSFDPDCRGMKDHTAKLSIAGGLLQLEVYPSNSLYSGEGDSVAVSTVFTNSNIKMWLVEGLLSIATGDFDGDSEEEIAVYAPDNTAEYNYQGNSKIEIKIYSYDPEKEKITEEQVIDLTDMGDTGKTCTWNKSKVSDSNCEYYRLPYVALTADDVNGDGIDDLMAVMNFSTQFNGVSSSTQYTTSQVLDPTTCWASLLEVYEGTNGGKLANTVLHKPLVANGSGDNSDYRYVIRHANAIVADVTAEGSKEIVIGGRYTKISYKNATGNTKVNSTRESYRDSENYVFANILGYASYETIKAYPVSQEGAPYKWVMKNATTDTLRHYEYSENNPIQQPVSLCGYKFNGFGHPDRIFIEGQNFEYDAEEGTLVFKNEVSPSNTKKGSSTNRWYGRAVAANSCDDKFGTEILAVPYFNKIDSKEQYYAYVVTVQPRREFAANKFMNNTNINMLTNKRIQTVSKTLTTEVPDVGGTERFHVCLDWGDLDDDSTFISYEDGDTDVYYSKVEALAIMQAPPLYEELGVLDEGDHHGNSSTSFAKSKGEGTGSSLGGSLTAGVVAGFEQETSFLGLFKVAGGEFELKVTATASYDKATSTSFDYSTGFATSGTTDAVAIFTVPYVRYNCTMLMPEYQVPTEEEYNIKKAFCDELKANVEAYAETNVDQVSGTYAWGIKEYDYMYHSRVYGDNYGEQLGVLETVAAEVNAIEKAVAACGKGGDKEWGETVENAILPYHYCIPQAPLVTTVDVETYDAMADYLGLDKISEKVFNNGYVAGDPNTYAHEVGQLKKGSGKVLEGKNTASSSNDGFLSNSNLSAPGTSQSQTITVETEDEQTLGWAAGIETTIVANAGGAFGGVTAAAEVNGSYVWTSTQGNEYSGEVVALPEGSSADYTYNWKLVSYNAKLNGRDVPVVGYLTKVNTVAPPSVAQNISVEDVTATSATITWEDGNRPAAYYKLSRVYKVNGQEQKSVIANNITAVDGKYSYTINFNSKETSTYVLESFSSNNRGSVPTDKIMITPFPEDFTAAIAIEGIDENVIYRSGKTLNASSSVTGNTGYDTLYQWQKNDGDGWEDIEDYTADSIGFEVSVVDNESRIRCKAIFMKGDTAYVVYSNPLTINCAKKYNGCTVDWNDEAKSVTVTFDEGVTPADAYLKAEDVNGYSYIIYKSADSEDRTFDLSEIPEGSTLTVYIWEDGMEPVTYPFEG